MSNKDKTPETPAAQTPSAPAAQTPSAPAAQTPSAPAAQTPSAPAAQTPSAPAAQTPSAPADQTPSAPAAQTPSAPVPRKFATRMDKVDEQPQSISLSPTLEIHLRERVHLALQACDPTINVGAVYFLREKGQVKIFPAEAGAAGSVPLKLGPGGRTAECAGGLGFRKKDIPLLSQGTVLLPAVEATEPDGVKCLVVRFRTAELAKESTGGRGSKSKSKSKSKGTGKKGKKGAPDAQGKQDGQTGNAGTSSPTGNSPTGNSAPGDNSTPK